MRFIDRNLETVGGLVEALKDYAVSDKITWFRGQADAKWELVPSIARNAGHLKAEPIIIKVFKQYSRPHLIDRPGTEWEWVFLMQHHRAPTRLLD